MCVRPLSQKKNPYASLSAEQEVALAESAQELLEEARDKLTAHPGAEKALKKNKISDGLAVSLRACLSVVRRPSARREIRRLLEQADALHWQLALSGSSLLRWEASRVHAPAAERDDIMQHGYIGLLKAARRFEPARKLRFSTYARWWVRAQMQEAMAGHGRLVRLPSSATEALGRLMQLVEHRKATGGPLTAESLAEDLDISARQVRLLMRQGGMKSIEEEVNGVAIGDTLSVESTVEEKISEHQLLARSRAALKELSPREQEILCRHFGLQGHKKESLTAIGRHISLSRERVRQLEKLSLQSMAAVVV